MNNENVIENKVCFSDNNIFKENIFPKNNYIEKKIIKSRNIVGGSGNDRKISNCSGDNNFEKNNTNINSVLNSNIENNIKNLIYQVESTRMKTENKFTKNNQLDSIVEEINEEENYIKTKSKNKSDKVICDNSFSGKKYNTYLSYDIELKNNIAINSTGISSKFSTGKLTNNIFDIPSDDDNNINYIEKNNIENEKENENKTFTDYEHDTENTFLNSIKPIENDNSISFINENNKIFLSPLKKGLNDIDYNNLVINNMYNYNNSALNKKNNNSFDEMINKIPRINNNFVRKITIDLKNRDYIGNNKNTTYIKKRIKKSDKFTSHNIKKLIIPKIKEIKLSFKKNIKENKKIFLNDNQKLQKINKDFFLFDNINLKSLIFQKEKIYTKTMIVPTTNINSILIDNSYISIEEIEQIRKNNIKDDFSYLDKKKLSADKNYLNSSTIITTLDSENKIKNGCNNDINNFNLLINNNNNNIHSRNKSRNKIERKNNLPHEKSSKINLSNEYNSNEINKGNSFSNKNVKENENKIDTLNKIHLSNYNEQDKKYDNFENQYSKENKFYVSIESYEEFIQNFINQTQKIMNELLSNNNSQSKIVIHNEKKGTDLDKLMLDLERNIKLLKYNHLYILVKKHYTREKEDKINIIKRGNIIMKRKNFSTFFQKMINKIEEKLKLDNIEYKKKYINKILEILICHKTINQFEIKYSKKIYNEETKFSPEILYNRFDKIMNENNLGEKNRSIFKILKDNGIINKKIIFSTTIIIPILYGITYLSSFYNNDNIYK